MGKERTSTEDQTYTTDFLEIEKYDFYQAVLSFGPGIEN
jgi:hypothetical protein